MTEGERCDMNSDQQRAAVQLKRMGLPYRDEAFGFMVWGSVDHYMQPEEVKTMFERWVWTNPKENAG